jgi:hypothetical protein
LYYLLMNSGQGVAGNCCARSPSGGAAVCGNHTFKDIQRFLRFSFVEHVDSISRMQQHVIAYPGFRRKGDADPAADAADIDIGLVAFNKGYLDRDCEAHVVKV